jgi:hypothetical protein
MYDAKERLKMHTNSSAESRKLSDYMEDLGVVGINVWVVKISFAGYLGWIHVAQE